MIFNLEEDLPGRVLIVDEVWLGEPRPTMAHDRTMLVTLGRDNNATRSINERATYGPARFPPCAAGNVQYFVDKFSLGRASPARF